MLHLIGAKDIASLFSDVPSAKRFPELKLPSGRSEYEVLSEVETLSKKNLSADGRAWFLGAGAYNHFIPSVVPALASRGEFLTAYTPYQPEVSQGTLQAIFEYQSMAAELLGMAVVNASHYDGATALAEAVLMAFRLDESKSRILVPEDLHPEYKGVLATYLSSFDATLVEYRGSPESAPVDGTTACLVAGYPTFSGEVYPLAGAARLAHEAGALFIVHADPILCAILESPGAQGADIVAGVPWQNQHQPVDHILRQVGHIAGFLGGSPVCCVQHQVITQYAQFGIDAADDLANIAGTQVWDQHADNVTLAPSQAARLPVGGEVQPLHGSLHPLSGFRRHVNVVIDYTRDRAKRNSRFGGYFDDRDFVISFVHMETFTVPY